MKKKILLICAVTVILLSCIISACSNEQKTAQQTISEASETEQTEADNSKLSDYVTNENGETVVSKSNEQNGATSASKDKSGSETISKQTTVGYTSTTKNGGNNSQNHTVVTGTTSHKEETTNNGTIELPEIDFD